MIRLTSETKNMQIQLAERAEKELLFGGLKNHQAGEELRQKNPPLTSRWIENGNSHEK